MACAAVVDKQPDHLGEPSAAFSASTDEQEGHTATPETLQEPVQPLKNAGQNLTADTKHAQSGPAVMSTGQQPRQQEEPSGVAQDPHQDSRGKPAQHALLGGPHKWAQYASSSAKQLSTQQSAHAKPLTKTQACSSLISCCCVQSSMHSVLCLMTLSTLCYRSAGVTAKPGLCRRCQQHFRQYTATRLQWH